VPIYEYKCPNAHVFEVFQRFDDEPLEACQVCGASPVVKVLYPAAVHFKGSGFYSTDYGKGGKKRTAGDSAASSSDGGSSSASESAPKTEKPASSSSSE
jgi:putative FmdB family regulatory protein